MEEGIFMINDIHSGLFSIKAILSSKDFLSLSYALKLKKAKELIPNLFDKTIPKEIVDYFSIPYFVTLHKMMIHQDNSSTDVSNFIWRYRFFVHKFFFDIDESMIQKTLSALLDVDEAFLSLISNSSFINDDLSFIHSELKLLESPFSTFIIDSESETSSNYPTILHLIEGENEQLERQISKISKKVHHSQNELNLLFDFFHHLDSFVSTYQSVDEKENDEEVIHFCKKLTDFIKK